MNYEGSYNKPYFVENIIIFVNSSLKLKREHLNLWVNICFKVYYVYVCVCMQK